MSTNSQHISRQQLNAAFLRLVVKALGYIVTMKGPVTATDILAAKNVMSDLTTQDLPSELIDAEWASVARNRQATLGEIASFAPHLPDEYKEWMVTVCVRFVRAISISPQAAQLAIAEIANALRILPERSQRVPSPTATSVTSKSIAFNIISIVIILVALYLGDYAYDSYHYNNGFQAAMRAECSYALGELDPVLSTSILGVPSGIPNPAQFAAAEIAEQCGELSAAQISLANDRFARALSILMKIDESDSPPHIYSGAQDLMHSIIETTAPILLADHETCGTDDTVPLTELFGTDTNAIAEFFFGCARVYESGEASARRLFGEDAVTQSRAFDTYVQTLASYPDSTVAMKIEQVLLASSLTCGRTQALLREESIVAREAFIDVLYQTCGSMYEEMQDYVNAVRLYEEYLDRFAEHPQVVEVSTALARSLFQRSLALGAPEIPEPVRSGDTRSGSTVVTIQNDTPEDMVISFSGVESRIEKLNACTKCQTFSQESVAECLNLGPTGTYTLTPGTYDVTVNAAGNAKVLPFRGTWDLRSGSKYSNCFYIVRNIFP